MATEILMPALSPTMEEGTLAKWLVKEGDTQASNFSGVISSGLASRVISMEGEKEYNDCALSMRRARSVTAKKLGVPPPK